MSLIRTIPENDWSTIDDRAWAHPGAIVDLGCRPWSWSSIFINKKRIVGADPFADEIPGTELFKGVVGAYSGTTRISINGESSNVLIPGVNSLATTMITWKQFKTMFSLTSIAILKINIEGSEYPLLKSMDEKDFSEIDQIAVSFHHFVWPNFAPDTELALKQLDQAGYRIIQTNIPWNWYLCLR